MAHRGLCHSKPGCALLFSSRAPFPSFLSHGEVSPASALLPLPVPITILPLPTPRMASGVDSKPEVHSAGSLGLPRRQSYWPDALTSTIVRLIQKFLQTWVQEEKSCEGFHQQSPLL